MQDYSEYMPLAERLGGRNLYLIGMMGSGKTKTGPFIAKSLGYGFVDLDNVAEQYVGKSIAKIFKDEGEIAFREIEKSILSEIGKRHSLVVSTGGGVVTLNQNWGILHQGIVIWIDPSREVLLKRLQFDGAEKRPLLNKSDFIENFDSLLEERKSLYKQADFRQPVNQESAQEVAQSILQNLPSILKNPLDPDE